MLTDFKGFNSVIYSTSYIAELCEKEENVPVNRDHSHVFNTKLIPTSLKGCGLITSSHQGMLDQYDFFLSVD